jgi:hypothetical protein
MAATSCDQPSAVWRLTLDTGVSAGSPALSTLVKIAATIPAMPRPHSSRNPTSAIRTTRRILLTFAPVIDVRIDSPRRIVDADPPFAIAFSWSGGIADPSDAVLRPDVGSVGGDGVVGGRTAAPAAAAVPPARTRSRTSTARSPLVCAESTRSVRKARSAAVS